MQEKNSTILLDRCSFESKGSCNSPASILAGFRISALIPTALILAPCLRRLFALRKATSIGALPVSNRVPDPEAQRKSCQARAFVTPI